MNVINQNHSINPAAMLLISITIFLLPCHSTFGHQPSYTFGVVPQHASLRLVRDWVPFLADLSSRSGISLEFRTTKDIPTFERCLAVGAFDFAYMNPYHYTVYHDVAKYIAFARQRDHKLRGLIVVRQDSWIKEIKDLDGLEVAFPSPAAFGASAIQRAELRLLGIQVSPSYVASHDSVYRTVDAGLFEAGGGVIRTLSVAPSDVRSRLRVLYEPLFPG
jgi:phosphonate transport system substrate-binding protein